MKNITLYVADMNGFFEAVNSSKGKVLITDSNGKSSDLRHNAFLQELLMTAHKGNEQTAVELFVENPADFSIFIDFMMSDKIAC